MDAAAFKCKRKLATSNCGNRVATKSCENLGSGVLAILRLKLSDVRPATTPFAFTLRPAPQPFQPLAAEVDALPLGSEESGALYPLQFGSPFSDYQSVEIREHSLPNSSKMFRHAR